MYKKGDKVHLLKDGSVHEVAEATFEASRGSHIKILVDGVLRTLHVDEVMPYDANKSAIQLAATSLSTYLNRSSLNPWCHSAITKDKILVLVTRRVYGVEIPTVWHNFPVESQWVGQIRLCNE